MLEAAAVLSLAFLLDLLIGDPHYRFHPVRMIGRLISFIEQKLRSLSLEGKVGGVLLALIVAGVTIAVFLSVHILLHAICRIAGACSDVFICYSALALKDLVHHVKDVIHTLKKDSLNDARESIGMIVGRDVTCLDQTAIARAAIETLAENFVDGFVSPVCWYLVGAMVAALFDFAVVPTALAFMLVFKVVSTLDSMVGYKTPEFFELGWAGARLDDIMNFIPARLSLIILFLGAWVSCLRPLDGFLTALRDRLKHTSPNSAHAESFFAGALHCRLGGPTIYHDGLRAKEWLGGKYPDPSLPKISTAIRMTIFSAITTVGLALCVLIVWA